MTVQHLDIVALQISILLTVFAFGLRATPADVVRVLREPAFLARAVLAMFVVMPVFAVLVARTFELRPPVEIGLAALALSPVPPLLPGRQAKAGVEAGEAIGLMAVLALLSIVIVPISVDLIGRSLGRSFATPPASVARIAGLMLILPLGAGMAARTLAPAVAARIVRPVGQAGKFLLVLAAMVLLVAAAPGLYSLAGAGTLPAIAAFVIVGLAVGHWLGGPRHDSRVLLALSTANRHPAIAFAIAKTNFPDEPLLGAAILLYLLLGAAVGLPYLKRQQRQLAVGRSPA